MLRDFCDRMSFVLDGGVLSLLEERLGREPGSTVVLQEAGRALSVVAAVRFVPASLSFSEGLNALEGLFAPEAPTSACGAHVAEPSPEVEPLFEGHWREVVRLAGGRWRYYLLCSEPLSPALRGDLGTFARLMGLWQDHQALTPLETRLSRLSYTLMAARSAIASIFEPMPVEYFASFLGDVLRESVFTRRLAVLEDRKTSWRHLWGEPRYEPERQGVFRETRILPSPLAVDEDHAHVLGSANLAALRALGIHVVLPLVGGPHRLFALMGWERAPSEEDMNFLALFVHVASKALEISALHEENQRQLAEVSSKVFAMEGLHASTLHLMRQHTRPSLLEAACDILREMSQTSRLELVIWKPQAGAYVLHGARGGEAPHPEEVLHRGLLEGDVPREGLLAGDEIGFFCEKYMPELQTLCRNRGLERLLLLGNQSTLYGVVGLAPAVTGGLYGDPMAMKTLAGSVVVGLERCQLLERITEHRDALDRRLLFMRLLRDIAEKVQEIHNLDLLCESVESSLRLALGAQPPYLILQGDQNSGRAELLAQAMKLEVPRVVTLLSGRPMLLTPLWSGRRCWGTIAVSSLEGVSLHSEEAEELFSLLAPLVAPRLASLMESRVWRRGHALDVDAMVRHELRLELERLESGGMEGELIVRPGRAPLNPGQEEMARLVVLGWEWTWCLVPFGWDEEMREIFSPEEGWKRATERAEDGGLGLTPPL